MAIFAGGERGFMTQSGAQPRSLFPSPYAVLASVFRQVAGSANRGRDGSPFNHAHLRGEGPDKRGLQRGGHCVSSGNLQRLLDGDCKVGAPGVARSIWMGEDRSR
jgi:hypothetical protein